MSLAIWMGGVSAEIDRLRRQVGAYGQMLTLLGQDPVVDIVSGTSAGGLNGVLLATAVANGSKADSIRSVWEKRADFKDLLRSVNESDPPSLLRGDEYFLVQLNEALHDVRAGGVATPSDAEIEPVPLQLFVTVSLEANRARQYIDATGAPIGEIDHRGTMKFDEQTLRAPDKIATLALAARSSASFPIAFEPSWVPVKGLGSPASGTDVAHPDMSDHAWWNGSGYVLDGGLVLNRPLRPALEAISNQPAARAVRRVVLLVNPNPQTKFDTQNEARKLPTLLAVGKAMANIMTTQSIADDLEELRRHNEQVTMQRGLRRALSPVAVAELVAIATPFRETYASQRGSVWARNVVSELATRRVLVDDRRLDDVDSPLESELAAARTAVITAALAPVFEPAPGAEGVWAFDTEPLERAARDALWVMHTLLDLRPGDTEAHQTVRHCRFILSYFVLGSLQSFIEDEITYWVKTLGATAPDERVDKVRELYAGFPDWYEKKSGRAPSRFYADVASQLASAVHSAYALVPELLRGEEGQVVLPVSESDALLYREIDDETAAVTAPVPGYAFVPGRRDLFYERRAVLIDVARAPMLASAVPNDEALDLVNISANAPNCFDGRELPEQKLTGLQLNHFGAFYRAAWRGNDWMWGRLDAAHHLVRAVLEPARLQRANLQDPVELLESLVCAATGLPASAATAVLAKKTLAEQIAQARNEAERCNDADVEFCLDDFGARFAAVLQELAQLRVGERSWIGAANLPPSFPVTSAWVTRRLQLGILREELPKLASDVRTDVDAGAENSPAQQAFLEKAALLGSTPTPDQLVDAFKSCEIGSERIAQEVHSQLFAEISSQSAAVALNAITGKSGFTPLRPVLGGARGLSKALFRLTQTVRERKPVALALVGLISLLAAGTIAVSIATGGRLANPIVAVAIPVAAAVALMALMRDRTGIGVAASFAVVIVGWLAGILWASSLSGVVQVTLALVATLLLLSLVYGISESRKLAVVIVACIIWLAGIGVSALAAEHTITWSHVAVASDCGAATVVVEPQLHTAAVGPTTKTAPATASKPVLCITGDRHLAARAVAGLTLVVLLGGAVAFLWIGLARRDRERRAREAKLLAGMSGAPVAWYTKRWGSRNGAFVDDHGLVVAWEKDGAVYNSAGALCGWWRSEIVRDRQGRVAAFIDGVANAGLPLPPVTRPVRGPRPAPLGRRPTLADAPARPLSVSEASPLSWSTMLSLVPEPAAV